MAGKLERHAAGRLDARADALGKLDVVAVAGRQVGAGLGDADQRLAGLQLLAGEAVIQVALQVERGHAGIIGIVEPFLRTEFLLGRRA